MEPDLDPVEAEPAPARARGDSIREDGGVLLVSCYELGHPPLGIAWPAAFLERAGFRPVLVDLAMDRIDDAQLSRAMLIGISTPMHTALALGVRAAERARRVNPHARIVFFGHYALLHRSYLLEGFADWTLAGEIEEALVSLATDLAEGRAPAAARAALKTKLDFPVPSRHALRPLDRYSKLVIHGEERPAGAVESSRGCLHLCRHCPIPAVYDGRFFVVPSEVVLADVSQLVAQGAKHITFHDADFLNAPIHARRIARAIHDQHPHLTFDFTAKIEHLLAHAAIIPELADSGCVFIVSAVESLSKNVLEILDKGHTGADVERTIRILDDAGVALRPSLLPFTPWSTLEDYVELLRFIAEHGLVDSVDPVQLTVRLLVPPGSLLERHPEMVPHLRTFRPEALTWSWAHPDPRMDALQEDVTVLVKHAARGEEDIEATFEAIGERACAALGGPARRLGFRREHGRPIDRTQRPPRLTEPWFC